MGEWARSPSLTEVTAPCVPGFTGTMTRVCGADGVWGAVIAAEALALLLSIACLMRNRKKYGYA